MKNKVIISLGIGIIVVVAFGLVLWHFSTSSLLERVVYLGISWVIFSMAAYAGQEVER